MSWSFAKHGRGGSSLISRRLIVCALASSIAGAGCSKYCTTEDRVSFFIEVQDAKTRELICDADIVARDGNYELKLKPSCLYAGPVERPGVYTTRVERRGYLPAMLEIDIGSKDECDHVTSRNILVSLDVDPRAVDAGP